MERNLYIKSLWTSLVLAWACVIPLMGQTIPTGGGSLTAGATYKLTRNVTITGRLDINSGSVIIDLNGYVLSRKVSDDNKGFIFYVEKGATLTIIDSNSTKVNKGNYGIGGAEVTINGGIITGGRGDRGGAGIICGTLNLNGGTIAGCVTSDDFDEEHPENGDGENINVMTQGCGGAIYLQAAGDYAGKLVMNGGHIAYCQTQHTAYVEGEVVGLGGAVFIDSEGSQHGTFELKNGSIYGCIAGVGGAVYVHSPQANGDGNGGKFIMSGGSIYNCAAVYKRNNKNYGGGAVFVSSNIITNEDKTTTIKGKGTFNMTGGEIYKNETNGDGNGVYSNGIFSMSGTAKIYKNRPYSWEDKGSADSYPFDEKTSKPYNADVNLTYGGGVFIYKESATFTMNGGSIEDNYAASGGGVMVWNDAVFTMKDGRITRNHAIGKATVGNGGAVYVQNSTFNFNGGTLSNNTARRYGGAININQSAKLNLNSGTIQGNAASHGGGISQEQGECVMVLNSGIEIIGNEAHGMFPIYSELETGNDLGNGGGIFIEKGKLTINDGVTISDNTASGKGGGVSLYVSRIVGDIQVEMLGGLVSNNTASGTGGGIDVYADKNWGEGETDEWGNGNTINDVDVNIQGGTFSGNKALVGGGVHIGVNTGNSVARMTVGTSASVPHINGNTATDSGGGFAMNNSGSTAANMGTVTIHNGELIGNTAVDGGGFFVKNGKVSITTCKISGNEASQYGGGLYVYNDTETSQNVTFLGGHFVSNTAAYGGGVALNGPINLTMQGDIENNLATNGGGLYLGSGGQMSFGQGLIRNNQATKNTTPMSNATAYQKGVTNVTGIGGGLFMDSNTSLVFTDEKQLGLYGNIADNGADDIFANGNGTSVVLPNVESMILTDFKVPTKSIYWVEDYITGDTGYDNGTKKATDGVVRRYSDALSQLKDIYKVSSAQYDNTYLCLALGYRLVFATIVKEGLKAGESAIFKVYPVGGNTDSTAPYASVLLTGSSESNSVSKRIALAEGTWRVEETNWSWNYTTSQDEAQKDGKYISESNSKEKNTFTFTNIPQETEIKYDEAIKVNTMGGTSTTAQ